MAAPDQTPNAQPKPPLKERLEHALKEYGPFAIGVYFAIFFVVLVGFALAIQAGVDVSTTTGTVGTWGAAWLATKLTQPFRIAATLALTPLVVRLARGARGEK